MPKKKIIRIITRLNIGGPAQHVIVLSRNMQMARFQTLLISGSCEKNENSMSYLADKMSVRPLFVEEMSRRVNPVKDFQALIKICRIIKKEKPDILHTHTAKAGTLGRLASIFAGNAVRVHTFHGHSLEGYFGKIQSIIFTAIERFLSYFTDRIVVISQTQLEELSGKYRIARKEKFSVIELGLDLDEFFDINENRNGKFRNEHKVDEDELLIGIVARLVDVKNHRFFLDVVKRIENTAREKKYKFIIAGDGELKKDLLRYAENLGIMDLVIFTGWYTDMLELYRALDIVVLTSENEGTPVSLIQALAGARPVLSTDAGGVVGVVLNEKNGYVVKKGDIKTYSEKLLDLAGDKEKRIKFGLAGREYVRKKFTTKRLVSDLEKLYTELLKTKIE